MIDRPAGRRVSVNPVILSIMTGTLVFCALVIVLVVRLAYRKRTDAIIVLLR